MLFGGMYYIGIKIPLQTLVALDPGFLTFWLHTPVPPL